ncbi:hypothetical protein [Spiroplasma endosymbiont of Polydrusus formosus]|uniref:hypothetical protein n=1 Tax=Spiroplasma endosymbiont of Polydrusus formosus TaxID=3139326 RepID=UPI0035B56690
MKKLENIYKIKVYFADANCSGQRELNKNNNGILIRSLPKWIDLLIFSQDYLNKIALKINLIPRKLLNYKNSLDLIQNIQ